MFVNLKSLNESLENLCESNLPLNERFDDSFPDWLKDRIVKVKKSGMGWDKRKDVPFDERPGYINARDAYNVSDMSLFDQALRKGIDLANTKVIEGPIPAKRTDPRLKEPNIPVWLFNNGQVYIEGINDNEIYRPMDKAFKYIPTKYKLEDAKGFAHIDGSKIDPNSVNSKRIGREDHAKELRNIDYGRYGKDPEKFGKAAYGAKRDKSGYIINPNKYKNELSRIKAKNIYVELDNFHDLLVDYKNKVQDAWASIDIFGSEGRNSISRLRGLMDNIDDAARYYNNYCQQVEAVLGKSYLDETQKLDRLADIINEMRNNYYMKQLKENGADIFLSEIDWD